MTGSDGYMCRRYIHNYVHNINLKNVLTINPQSNKSILIQRQNQ